MKLRKKILPLLLATTMVVIAPPITVFGATTKSSEASLTSINYEKDINAPEYYYPRMSEHFYIDENIPLSGLISPYHTYLFLQRMDEAYNLYEKLAGFKACNGQMITIKGSDDTFGAAWVYPNSIPNIFINNNNRDEWIEAIEKGFQEGKEDWCFGLLHELGHHFDQEIWSYNAELTANFKMAYILEEMNGYIIMNNDYAHQYVGAGIKDYYKKAYIESGNLENYFSGDAFTYALLDIKDKVGWNAYAQTFRELQQCYPEVLNDTSINLNNGFRINLFLTVLAKNSKYDVLSYFTEKQLEIIGQEYKTKIEYQPILGDFDCNGYININDVTTLQYQIAMVLAPKPGINELTYDNGNINIIDVTKLQLYIAHSKDLNSNYGKIQYTNPKTNTFTLTFYDSTPQSWVKNDNAYLSVINSNTQEEIVMKPIDSKTWIATVPLDTTSITFARKNPETGEVWNYWTTSREIDDTQNMYVATGNFTGYWTINVTYLN